MLCKTKRFIEYQIFATVGNILKTPVKTQFAIINYNMFNICYYSAHNASGNITRIKNKITTQY